jgi:Tol biopolymer transport system component
MNPDCTGVVQLTHFSDGTHQAFVGAWSPDGSKIVYHVRGPEPDTAGVQNQLYVMNADGTGVRRLTHLPTGVDPSHPSWSPAG